MPDWTSLRANTLDDDRTWEDLRRAEKIDLLVEGLAPPERRQAIRRRVEDALRGDLVPPPMDAMNVMLREAWAHDHDGDPSAWDRAARGMRGRS